ncbi:MAG: V-type ATPase 116kDa subunit family protein [Spirochaetia bacterium]|jgi:V/A-type H+-transporting ATPase subunit I
MLFMERMKKLELLVLKRDVDAVMRYLGFAGCLQLIVEGGEQTAATPAEREIAELRTKVDAIARFLDLPTAVKADRQRASRPREALRAAAEKMARETADIVAEESRLIQNRLNLKKSLEELSAFSELTVPFSELSNLAYLTFRLGAVPEEKLEELTGSLSDRAIIVALKKPGHIMAITARKGKWALDSELAKFNFVPLQLPADATGVPADVIKAVEQDLAQTEEALSRLEERKRILRQSQGEEVIDVLVDLDLAVTIDSVKQSFSSTGSVMRVSGWIPRRKFAEVAAELEKISQGRLALESWDPQELPEVRSGKVKVPVSVRHGRIVRSFERMVFSYSVPLYGTLDPTPFVAGMFVLLFAIMFGDVGQGFVGLLLGLLITSGRVKSFESYRQKHFGTVFIVVGFASMVTGLLYGSFFANEQVLVPVSRFITQLVTGRPVDHIISLSGFQKIILFFGFTVGVGAVINTIGLLINLVNLIGMRRWEEAILNKTGLAGAIFFWYLLSIGVRMILGRGFSGADLVILAVPLAALFFREPIVRLAEGKRPVLKDGLFAFIMEGIVEILESGIYYISNSVSFLRVAAFALAHAVLSAIVFLLADMVGGAAGGIIFRWLVILLGNSIIIVLEGLIVTIQVVRLQYYEFFSKFFTESGEEFRPFTLRSSGGTR